MEILYALNILAAVALMFWPAWFSRRVLGLPTLNPFTVSMAIGLPVQMFKFFGGPMALIDDGLADTGYQFALLMSNVQIVAQTLGTVLFYQFFTKTRVDRYLPLRRLKFVATDLGRAEVALLLLCGLSYVILALSDFGLVGWLTNPREGYQLHRTGAGQWYALAQSFLGAAFVVSFMHRPTARHVLTRTLLYLFLSFFLGSKGVMLAIFISAVVFLWFIRWKHLNKLLLVGTPVVIVLLLFNLYLAMSDGFGIDTILEYFDYFKNAADYYRAYFTGEVKLFHGEVLLTSLWAYAPRGFWPDKPVVYGILLVDEIFYPGQAELTNTPAFGGAVEQFADFGIPGVVVLSLFSAQSIVTAFFSYLTFRRPGIEFGRVTLAAIAIMVVQFAPGFGSYFPGALYAVVLGLVLLVVRACRWRGEPATGTAPPIGHTAPG
jgi:hypothetical protein